MEIHIGVKKASNEYCNNINISSMASTFTTYPRREEAKEKAYSGMTINENRDQKQIEQYTVEIHQGNTTKTNSIHLRYSDEYYRRFFSIIIFSGSSSSN